MRSGPSSAALRWLGSTTGHDGVGRGSIDIIVEFDDVDELEAPPPGEFLTKVADPAERYALAMTATPAYRGMESILSTAFGDARDRRGPKQRAAASVTLNRGASR
jgi:hypothetical protein